MGGRRNRKFGGVNLEVPENMTATDLRHLMIQAMRSLLAGELQAREAGALVQLCNLQLRLITTADLENRVNKLEQQKAQPEQEKESPLDSASTSSNMNDVEAATSVNLEQLAEQPALCSCDADPSDRTGGQNETESREVESDPTRKP
jgi:hypothetical protein